MFFWYFVTNFCSLSHYKSLCFIFIINFLRFFFPFYLLTVISLIFLLTILFFFFNKPKILLTLIFCCVSKTNFLKGQGRKRHLLEKVSGKKGNYQTFFLTIIYFDLDKSLTQYLQSECKNKYKQLFNQLFICYFFKKTFVLKISLMFKYFYIQLNH